METYGQVHFASYDKEVGQYLTFDNPIILMQRLFVYILLCAFMGAEVSAQSATSIKRKLNTYFHAYSNPSYTCKEKARVEKFLVRQTRKEVEVVVSEVFLGQPFTNEVVSRIYNEIRPYLPPAYRNWDVIVSVNGYPIEELVPAGMLRTAAKHRYWGEVEYKNHSWTFPLSRPFAINNGMQGRHLAVWASHGRYYDFRKEQWRWQRPGLFGTCEDILTPSIATQFLMPMLENAGAVVFSPRERDTQVNEVIVDNDRPQAGGTYREDSGPRKWDDAGRGFAHLRETYRDMQNPFDEGSARKVVAQSEKEMVSSVTWTPDIPESGEYAVYVSYKSLPTSVPDAVYTIRHQGISTLVAVNQRMGGGTWVYLGTFAFDKGQSLDGSVSLSNHSSFQGHVTADAVRFGGGMGNIERGDPFDQYQTTSGLPRYLEGARYYMQWAGMPYRVYSTKEGENDYADDINARGHGVNHVARGSVFMPNDTLPGLRVPLELSIGLHTDAGLRDDMDIIGTLGIYTTQFYDKQLATGLSRLCSRDLADATLSQVYKDLSFHLGLWNRRSLYDRNYSESREPQVPSMILEMLSHQNYADMLVAHDPYCKFLLARAVYKAMLRHTASMHQCKAPTVQPLPVKDVAAVANVQAKHITLSWSPQDDPLEESAKPTSYIIYIRQNDRGWDNGTVVNANKVNIAAVPGVLYRFRIAALNDGGSSMRSEEVCARVPYGKNTRSVLIVNGFERVAAAQAVDMDTLRGFDMRQDPGVAYMKDISIYDLNGMPVAGNTFDYPALHAKDLLLADEDFTAHRDMAISSCTVSALPQLPVKDHCMIDLILGAQRFDGYSHRTYQAFPEHLQRKLSDYAASGGGILVSGAYVGEDLRTDAQKDFARRTLKYTYAGSVHTDSMKLAGMGTEFGLLSYLNPYMYTTTRVNALQPADGAFATLMMNESNTTYGPATDPDGGGSESAIPVPQVSVRQLPGAVAYQGDDYRCITFGFPLEMIEERETRRAIINASYQFLCARK